MAHERDKPGRVMQANVFLQSTMKAIVAKSFGKRQSSSRRSRTVEKPDEPSEGDKKAKRSSSTCESEEKGKTHLSLSLFFPFSLVVVINRNAAFFFFCAIPVVNTQTTLFSGENSF